MKTALWSLALAALPAFAAPGQILDKDLERREPRREDIFRPLGSPNRKEESGNKPWIQRPKAYSEASESQSSSKAPPRYAVPAYTSLNNPSSAYSGVVDTGSSNSSTSGYPTATPSHNVSISSVVASYGNYSAPLGYGSLSSSSTVGSGSSSSEAETTVTVITTISTTVCPTSSTFVQGDSTTTVEYETTSTVTSLLDTTITISGSASSGFGSSSSAASIATDSYSPPTAPEAYQTSVDAVSYASGSSSPSDISSTAVTYTVPTGTASGAYPVGPYPDPTASTMSSSSLGSSGSDTVTATSSTAGSPISDGGSTTTKSCSTASGNASSSPAASSVTISGPYSDSVGTPSYSAPPHSYSFPLGNASYSSGPTGTVSTGLSSSSISPISTGYTTSVSSWASYSYSSTVRSITGTSPITVSSSTSTPFPAGNSTSSVPGSSGSIPSSASTTASSTSGFCSSKPTQTDFCIPCDGQPGKDPNNFCGYTINDNYYEVTPITCRTVEYVFEVTNTTVSPDGVERMGLIVNGQMPGPKIEANWGDTIIVHLHNKMQANGTSIHFHGIRQNYTNEMDGVPSITQCALAPGEKMTYTFRATNYGTSWWHSHFALQTYEGVFGPMIIHGPHSAEYDVDAGMVMVQDWSHATADEMYNAAQTVGPSPQNGPRVLDTGLINGLNVWGADGSANQTGSRFEMIFEPGKSYLLRVVNTAIQSTFKFYIDGHRFTVISTDFVPIVPYETDILNINIGQRYNIIVKADQTPGDYWLRSDNQNVCSQVTQSKNIKGIVHYTGFNGTPTSTAYDYTEECIDEPYASLVPVVPLTAGAEDQEIQKTVLIGPGPNTPNLFKWTLDGTTFQSQWGDPSLYQIYNNGTVPEYSGSLAIEVPNLGEWVYVIIESPIPLPHPIHLHGHDFFVLAQGTGTYDSSVPLKLDNPPRRDVALMPWSPDAGTGGYLVLAFETDNPGAWLMHCHIGWHVTMGFALQIIENLDGIKDTVTDSCMLNDTCTTWRQYAAENNIVVDDSGV